MNAKKQSKNEPRAIDAARIREAAKKIEADMHVIALYAVGLEHELNCLHEELEYADPCKDKLFEKFMYCFARFVNELNPSYEFDELVKAMQKFGLLPHAEQIEAPSATMHGQVIDRIPMRSYRDNSIISQEVIHA